MKPSPSGGPTAEIVAHVDGGSRGNPGPAAYGVVITRADGAPVAALSKCLGRTTNNVAEYQGLMAALEYALAHHHPRLRVLTDSELMARQIEGLYKVKSADLKPLFDRAREMIGRLEHFSIRHVPREQNAAADRLVNQALDGEAGLEPAPARPPASTIQTAATYRHGLLDPQRPLPFDEGEVVDLEIRRRK
jgi:ribonuclease HI